MITRRFFGILVVLALFAVAALTLRAGIATSAVVSTGRDLSDYALRHPNTSQVDMGTNLDDYALRHPNYSIQPESGADLSDWYLRHSAEFQQTSQPDLSDWYLRHASEFGR